MNYNHTSISRQLLVILVGYASVLAQHGCGREPSANKVSQTQPSRSEDTLPEFSFPASNVDCRKEDGKIIGLTITDERVLPSDVQKLGQLKNLRAVNFTLCITDSESIASLRDLPQIEGIGWQQMSIRDEDIATILDLPKLSTLKLTRTQISNDGIELLGKCTRLKWLDISFSQIPAGSLDKLRKSLPDTVIHATGATENVREPVREMEAGMRTSIGSLGFAKRGHGRFGYARGLSANARTSGLREEAAAKMRPH